MGARRFISKSLVKVFVGAMFFLLPGLANADNEWLTWGHDPERTGSNPDEKILNKDNVSQLEVKWTAQISTPSKDYVLSTMTAPIVAMVNTPQGPVRRVFVVDPGYVESESSLNLVTGKNHAGKIGLLQELDETSRDRRIVLNDVK